MNDKCGKSYYEYQDCEGPTFQPLPEAFNSPVGGPGFRRRLSSTSSLHIIPSPMVESDGGCNTDLFSDRVTRYDVPDWPIGRCSVSLSMYLRALSRVRGEQMLGLECSNGASCLCCKRWPMCSKQRNSLLGCDDAHFRYVEERHCSLGCAWDDHGHRLGDWHYKSLGHITPACRELLRGESCPRGPACIYGHDHLRIRQQSVREAWTSARRHRKLDVVKRLKPHVAKHHRVLIDMDEFDKHPYVSVLPMVHRRPPRHWHEIVAFTIRQRKARMIEDYMSKPALDDKHSLL